MNPRVQLIIIISAALVIMSVVSLLVYEFDSNEMLFTFRESLSVTQIASSTLILLLLLVNAFYRYRWKIVLSTLICLSYNVTLAFGLIAFLRLRLGNSLLPVTLAIVIYSLNSCASMFDCIIEARKLNPRWSGRDLVNHSINQNLKRSIMLLSSFMFILIPVSVTTTGFIRAIAISLLSGFIVSCCSSLFFATNIWAFLINGK